MDLDLQPNTALFTGEACKAGASEIYSYLRDRLRSIRVDLQVQGLIDDGDAVSVRVHTCCLRFELLFNAVLHGEADIKGKRSHDIGMVRKQFGLLLEAQKESYTQLRLRGEDAPSESFFR